MKLSILIPTVPGREELLRVVSCAHVAQNPDCEILTTSVYSWGEGLNQLATRAKGDYWLTACDDILPHAGWFEAARAMVDEGYTPATRYWHKDGSPLKPGTDDANHGHPISWCRSFLLTPEIFFQTGKFIDTTWWADINYSERLAVRRPIRACDGFSFTHLEGERDWLTPEEEIRQRTVYEDAARTETRIAEPWG